MALKQEQCDVYWLALEFYEIGAGRRSDGETGSGSGRSISGHGSGVDWAIDYLDQLPDDPRNKELIDIAHRGGDLTQTDARRVGPAIKAFYNRLHRKKLYSQGIYFLRSR